jgi:hypothetical protein
MNRDVRILGMSNAASGQNPGLRRVRATVWAAVTAGTRRAYSSRWNLAATDARQRHQPSPRAWPAFEGAGPAPVTLGPEVLNALYLGVELLLVPRPGQGGGMAGKVALVHDVAHPVEEPVPRHVPNVRGAP